MLACLYDVHGNLPALEAVLADARGSGAERYVLGGDYALFGGWPADTLARLRALEPAAWVRGNVDRWTADPSGAPEDPVIRAAIESCREALGEEDVAALGALPPSHDEGATLFVHASPPSDVRSFLPEPGVGEAELLEGVGAARLVFGHTHLAFRRRHAGSGIELLNPGSVGMPLDGDHRAAYALLHPDGRVEQRRVAYDHEASARRLEQAFPGAAWTDRFAARLRAARLEA